MGDSYKCTSQIIVQGKIDINAQQSVTDHKLKFIQIYKNTVEYFKISNQWFLDQTLKYIHQVLAKLKTILQYGDNQEQQLPIIIQRCQSIINRITEDQTYQQKLYFAQNESMELYSHEGLIHRNFFQELGEYASNGKQSDSAIISITGGLASILLKSIPEVDIPILILSQIGATGKFLHEVQQQKLDQSQQIWICLLDEWLETLNQWIEQIVDNYTNLFNYSLIELQKLVEKIIQ